MVTCVLPENLQPDIWCPGCGAASRIQDVTLDGIAITCGCFLPSDGFDVQITGGAAGLEASASARMLRSEVPDVRYGVLVDHDRDLGPDRE